MKIKVKLMNKKYLILLLSLFIAMPYGFVQKQKLVLPTKAQVDWANAEVGVLIHFDLQVFKPEYNWRRDMGNHPDASVFNPTELNTDQWIEAAKAIGSKYAILVAKHCSGFSLWPTNVHEYSVKNSPWKNGQGDLVKDFIASCKKYGVKPGLYYSTSANGYFRVDNPGKVLSGDPEEQKRYVKVVESQLTELWSNYGELFEIWFDGGVLPPEKGGFNVLSLLRKYQPNAIAFQGPYGYENNIRWVGNEKGVAPYPCWATADSTTSASGVVEIRGLNGNPDGEFWCPGEADFPLRWNSAFQGGWFWKKGEDEKIFTVDQLTEKYEMSIGRNTNMLIGIVIDDRGLVPDADVNRLKEFGQAINKRFSNKLGEKKGMGNEFVINLKMPQKVNYVIISEDIKHGERIRKYRLEGLKNNTWVKISEGESVGNKRIEGFPTDTYSKIKLVITEHVETPMIKAFQCYYADEILQ
jgi:alpha-L-fucosidase